jgi:hypothetical protein
MMMLSMGFVVSKRENAGTVITLLHSNQPPIAAFCGKRVPPG